MHIVGDFPTVGKMAGCSRLSLSTARPLVRITKGLRFTWLRSASSGAWNRGTERDESSKGKRQKNTVRLLSSAGALGAWGLYTATKYWKEKNITSELPYLTHAHLCHTLVHANVRDVLATQFTLALATCLLHCAEELASLRMDFHVCVVCRRKILQDPSEETTDSQTVVGVDGWV